MKLSDRQQVTELTEKFTKAVQAMRALNEHAGELKITFGAEAVGFGSSYTVPVDADDRGYGQLMDLARQAARRRVAELTEGLAALGVDVNA